MSQHDPQTTMPEPDWTEEHPRALEQIATMAWFADKIANIRDADGVLVHEVRIGGEFLRDLRGACGVRR